jgi:glycosyltransferase involved in cell wall biosynthesis
VTLEAHRGALPEDLAWVADQPTFVYAGAHGPANGLDLVLDAALLLRDTSDPVSRAVRVLLIGDGVDRDRLAARVAAERITNVRLHGPIPKASVRALLEVATGGLMVLRDVPLFRFGVSPNKLYDYLAADLPVITNVAGDVADIVATSGGGIVVDPDEAPQLAEAMRRIATDGWPSGGGPAYVGEHHDRVRLAERLDAVVDEVITLRAARRRGAARSRVPRG